jgi:hypothetical protein
VFGNPSIESRFASVFCWRFYLRFLPALAPSLHMVLRRKMLRDVLCAFTYITVFKDASNAC